MAFWTTSQALEKVVVLDTHRQVAVLDTDNVTIVNGPLHSQG